ncbi:MAG: hypothetical protein E6K97_11470 [Thaumarchaeota archaeon]|jgi:hypothetical protein|nr:MAG: hypothetical protein E6K97_11470 [Nitrososphaerota archaeon]
MKIHLKKQNKDITEEQKDLAIGVCDELMKKVKEQIYDIERERGHVEQDVLNFYRLLVMNQIKFILEASDMIESEYREELSLR